jgi:hypothetical protein
MQDPEVNSVDFDASDLDNITLTTDVRIVRNSECCGDECKEYTFNTDGEVSDEIVDKMRELRAADADVEFEANEGGCDSIEEGGGRYAKSYYGYSLEVEIGYNKPTAGRTTEQQAEFAKLIAALERIMAANNERRDFSANAPRAIEPDADRVRRIVLSNIGRPEFVSLGTVTVDDKVAASGMDELN